ncbi:MAG: rhodanese [Sedimenticola sp.]|nr:rhodanese [Sedimenticola sp.]
MKIYLVGGAVRDRLLNIPVKDRDWLVVGATEDEMLALGYAKADSLFPVFIHPETGEEYALARRETKTAPGYKGFSVEYGSDVTLDEDLQRRDFTINALVEDEQGELIDRVGGLEDIEQRRLRHITPAFEEDPVRLLRGARFIARFSKYGFSLSHETFRLMKQMASTDELTTLKRERVWQEMASALSEPEPWRFFETLHRCGALVTLLPKLAEAMGKEQPHGDQPLSAPIKALKRAVARDAEPMVRFVALFYGICQGPGGSRWLTRSLPVKRDYLDLLDLLQGAARFFPLAAQQEAAATLDLLIRSRAQQHPERLARLLLLAEILWPDLEEGLSAWLTQANQAKEAISPAVLNAEGFQGAALGRELRERQLRAIAAICEPVGQG